MNSSKKPGEDAARPYGTPSPEHVERKSARLEYAEQFSKNIDSLIALLPRLITDLKDSCILVKEEHQNAQNIAALGNEQQEKEMVDLLKDVHISLVKVEGITIPKTKEFQEMVEGIPEGVKRLDLEKNNTYLSLQFFKDPETLSLRINTIKAHANTIGKISEHLQKNGTQKVAEINMVEKTELIEKAKKNLQEIKNIDESLKNIINIFAEIADFLAIIKNPPHIPTLMPPVGVGAPPPPALPPHKPLVLEEPIITELQPPAPYPLSVSAVPPAPQQEIISQPNTPEIVLSKEELVNKFKENLEELKTCQTSFLKARTTLENIVKSDAEPILSAVDGLLPENVFRDKVKRAILDEFVEWLLPGMIFSSFEHKFNIKIGATSHRLKKLLDEKSPDQLSEPDTYDTDKLFVNPEILGDYVRIIDVYRARLLNFVEKFNNYKDGMFKKGLWALIETTSKSYKDKKSSDQEKDIISGIKPFLKLIRSSLDVIPISEEQQLPELLGIVDEIYASLHTIELAEREKAGSKTPLPAIPPSPLPHRHDSSVQTMFAAVPEKPSSKPITPVPAAIVETKIETPTDIVSTDEPEETTPLPPMPPPLEESGPLVHPEKGGYREPGLVRKQSPVPPAPTDIGVLSTILAPAELYQNMLQNPKEKAQKIAALRKDLQSFEKNLSQLQDSLTKLLAVLHDKLAIFNDEINTAQRLKLSVSSDLERINNATQALVDFLKQILDFTVAAKELSMALQEKNVHMHQVEESVRNSFQASKTSELNVLISKIQKIAESIELNSIMQFLRGKDRAHQKQQEVINQACDKLFESQSTLEKLLNKLRYFTQELLKLDSHAEKPSAIKLPALSTTEIKVDIPAKEEPKPPVTSQVATIQGQPAVVPAAPQPKEDAAPITSQSPTLVGNPPPPQKSAPSVVVESSLVSPITSNMTDKPSSIPPPSPKVSEEQAEIISVALKNNLRLLVTRIHQLNKENKLLKSAIAKRVTILENHLKNQQQPVAKELQESIIRMHDFGSIRSIVVLDKIEKDGADIEAIYKNLRQSTLVIPQIEITETIYEDAELKRMTEAIIKTHIPTIQKTIKDMDVHSGNSYAEKLEDACLDLETAHKCLIELDQRLPYEAVLEQVKELQKNSKVASAHEEQIAEVKNTAEAENNERNHSRAWMYGTAAIFSAFALGIGGYWYLTNRQTNPQADANRDDAADTAPVRSVPRSEPTPRIPEPVRPPVAPVRPTPVAPVVVAPVPPVSVPPIVADVRAEPSTERARTIYFPNALTGERAEIDRCVQELRSALAICVRVQRFIDASGEHVSISPVPLPTDISHENHLDTPSTADDTAHFGDETYTLTVDGHPLSCDLHAASVHSETYYTHVPCRTRR